MIELLIMLAILGILSSLGLSSYKQYLDRVDIAQAILDMQSIESRVELYRLDTGAFPLNLAVINAVMNDPWGNPYQYKDFTGIPGNGGKRKDKNLVPINTDFDLYSMGKDGDSKDPLTAPQSHDDIIRANNGSYWGLAERY